MNNSEVFVHSNAIAIVGIAGRFPGAKNIDDFWQNLRDGIESISFLSQKELESSGVNISDFQAPNYVKAASVIENIELFDASFFGFNPRDAEITDPQHRLFLECAWTALEDAGYSSESYEGSIGVYAGASISSYLLFNLLPNWNIIKSLGDLQTIVGNDKDYLATRVSYKLNLKGPSISVQTACSTSLVATHLACQGLLDNECDLALAGGVRIAVPNKAGYFYQEGSICSPDGHCRAFDAKAQGTIFGNGAGVVVLKRLSDALEDRDHIYAIIRGSAINNDGSLKIGYTAPSVEGQAKVIAEALAVAEVDPETIGYVEAHGTGTPLGDPIEITALSQVFRSSTKARSFCAIGSVKTNIGHLEAAAGITSLIKTVLMLKHKSFLPSLHFQNPNPQIDFANSPFYVNTKFSEWKVDQVPRRAGVSSFGIGGTNAHIVLEEASSTEPSAYSRPWQLLLLSARTSSALEKATQNLVTHLKQHPETNLADVAYTYQVGRKIFNHQRIIVCHNLDDAVAALDSLDTQRVLTHYRDSKEGNVIFTFSGQGSQYVNMALELYQYELTFRQHVNLCSEILKPHLGFHLNTILYPNKEKFEESAKQLLQTSIAQPALFVIEYALAKLLMEWGIVPHAMLGHSIGEYVAACLSGVFDLEDALALVAVRGQLMQKLPVGGMLSISLPEEDVKPLLNNKLSLSVNNAPCLCVVSGPIDAINQLEHQLTEQGVACRRLQTSHAFHSAMTEPILGLFIQQVSKISLKPPKIPYISNVTGTWITAAEATEPSYWAQHLRQTVRFAEGMQKLMEEYQDGILLEVGPGSTLSTLARQNLKDPTKRVILNSVRHPNNQCSDIAFLLNTLGQLWLHGTKINWSKFYAHEQRHRLSLPTYPFEGQRYWIDPPVIKQYTQITTYEETEYSTTIEENAQLPLHSRPELQSTYIAPCNETERLVADIWQKLLGIEQVGIYDNFFDLGGNSLIATQLLSKLRDTFHIELPQRSFFEAPTVAKLAQVIDTILLPSPVSTESLSLPVAVDLKAEAILDPTIIPEIASSNQTIGMAYAFLTGATGFLGAFLLYELLQQTQADVYCLVRSQNIEEGKQKIQSNLEAYSLWHQSFRSRIIPILGDLSKPFLGLLPEQYDKIASQVDVIYHNGATVNFTYPYASLKASNVIGTQEVLRLASQIKVKPVHFTSSIAVFESVNSSETQVIGEQYSLDRVQGLFRGYAQSKWVAENLIMAGRSRGLPISIYRPGNVAGHSQTGVCHPNDFIWRMMKGCIQLQSAPYLETILDITPVDYVSKAIIHLSMQKETLGKTFHLVNPSPVNWEEIVSWIAKFGYPLKTISYDQWQAELINNISRSQENALYPLASIFFGTGGITNEERFKQPRFDCQNTLNALVNSSIACPLVNAELLKIYFSYFVRSGFLNAPSPNKILAVN